MTSDSPSQLLTFTSSQPLPTDLGQSQEQTRSTTVKEVRGKVECRRRDIYMLQPASPVDALLLLQELYSVDCVG